MLSLCLCLVPQVSPVIFFFFFWSMPCGMWDLSSLTRDQTCSSALEAESHNHWTARKSSSLHFFCVFFQHNSLRKAGFLTLQFMVRCPKHVPKESQVEIISPSCETIIQSRHKGSRRETHLYNASLWPLWSQDPSAFLSWKSCSLLSG